MQLWLSRGRHPVFRRGDHVHWRYCGPGAGDSRHSGCLRTYVSPLRHARSSFPLARLARFSLSRFSDAPPTSPGLGARRLHAALLGGSKFLTLSLAATSLDGTLRTGTPCISGIKTSCPHILHDTTTFMRSGPVAHVGEDAQQRAEVLRGARPHTTAVMLARPPLRRRPKSPEDSPGTCAR